ncbi:MAG: sigma-70 family RNA polymerase sigma factor [Lachnospiraceae bacterium]|nr:sigma-70 family RNA polymerase sigma factor [Lachnospiraceae bacterium]
MSDDLKPKTGNDHPESRNRLLCRRIKDDDEAAIEDIIRENENMIKAIVGKVFSNPFFEEGYFGDLDMEGLLQEGRLAIIRAAKKYDEGRGIYFSTFAHEVIENAVSDQVRKSAKGYEAHMTRKGVTRIFLDDDPVDDTDETDGLSVSEKYGGDERDPVGDRAVYNLKIEKLGNRVLDLSPRMQALIIHHYGILTDEFKTYKETADYFHLDQTYAKYMIRNALKELRNGMDDGKII